MAKAFSVEDGNQDTSTLRSRRNREYSDIDLSFLKSASGDVFKKTSAAAVKQSVKNLLMTNWGEKPFRPVFGGNLNDLLFELADNPTISTLAPRIENVINNEEPRAEVQDIKVYNEADRNSIRCVITFKVVNVQELVTLTTSVSRIR
jgi:phage baseplate assembly protein W|tara:strand:+ start:229 stop:669 length:441 start_codon:yes stop_codon:yes gene_type:complete